MSCGNNDMNVINAFDGRCCCGCCGGSIGPTGPVGMMGPTGPTGAFFYAKPKNGGEGAGMIGIPAADGA